MYTNFISLGERSGYLCTTNVHKLWMIETVISTLHALLGMPLFLDEAAAHATNVIAHRTWATTNPLGLCCQVSAPMDRTAARIAAARHQPIAGSGSVMGGSISSEAQSGLQWP